LGSASSVSTTSTWASAQASALFDAARHAAQTSPRRGEMAGIISGQIGAVSPGTFASNPVGLTAYAAFLEVAAVCKQIIICVFIIYLADIYHKSFIEIQPRNPSFSCESFEAFAWQLTKGDPWVARMWPICDSFLNRPY
jgi:hypothetical protein